MQDGELQAEERVFFQVKITRKARERAQVIAKLNRISVHDLLQVVIMTLPETKLRDAQVTPIPWDEDHFQRLSPPVLLPAKEIDVETAKEIIEAKKIIDEVKAEHLEEEIPEEE